MNVTEVLVTTLLSGGFVGALATLVTSRTVARKTNAEAVVISSRAPAERDNIIVDGATAAVLTMQRALESAQSRIVELERNREQDQARIAELEARHETMQERVALAEHALGEARLVGQELSAQLRELRRDRTPRA